MKKATLAFYVAEYGNWVDKLIAWYTKSSFSHVEIVYNDWWYSTSPRDLKVRRKQMEPKIGHWVYQEIEIDEVYLEEFFLLTEGRKYDWLGIAFSVGLLYNLKFRLHSNRRYFCSEWVATVMKIKNPDKYAPQDLYNYVMMGRER